MFSAKPYIPCSLYPSKVQNLKINKCVIYVKCNLIYIYAACFYVLGVILFFSAANNIYPQTRINLQLLYIC